MSVPSSSRFCNIKKVNGWCFSLISWDNWMITHPTAATDAPYNSGRWFVHAPTFTSIKPVISNWFFRIKGWRDSRLLWFVPSKTTSLFTSTFSIIIKDSQIVQISTLWVASLKSALKFDFLFNHLIKFRACIYINKQLDIASASRFFFVFDFMSATFFREEKILSRPP